MITLCARHTGERTTAALPPNGPSWLACRAHGSLRMEEYFGTYLARLPDLAALRPPGSGGPHRCSRILAGHRVSCCWRQGGFCVRAGGTGGVRHRSRTPPAPVRAPGLDLRFLVAGPGFEPGKTVVGDFTERRRPHWLHASDLGGSALRGPADGLLFRHGCADCPLLYECRVSLRLPGDGRLRI
jgi:hypothetical protein